MKLIVQKAVHILLANSVMGKIRLERHLKPLTSYYLNATMAVFRGEILSSKAFTNSVFIPLSFRY